MPEVTVDVELYCGQCGAAICHLGSGRRNSNIIDVDPCDNCLKDAEQQGYDQGYSDGGN